jgi:hypothetical protein
LMSIFLLGLFEVSSLTLIVLNVHLYAN